MRSFRLPGLLVAAALAAACSASKTKPPVEAVPVSVATVVRKSVPVTVQNVGTVQPITSVAIRAQVSGELTEVHFREGQDVSRGELLFTIDPRPYQAALDQAEANLRRDRAQADNAALQAKRYEDLVKKDFVTREQADQIKANSEALAATAHADEAAIENARLELAYCSIRSPLDGRTGGLMVQAGNIVKPADATLVTINEISPIYVSFAVPERDLAEIRRRSAGGHLPAIAKSATDGSVLSRGELTFVDNSVDRTTGTIALKAAFSNADKALWPGQFVNVILTLSNEADAVVAPTSAIQSGQSGSYAFVVRSDDTVELRSVKIRRALGDSVVVDSGLAPGERVVTDGQLRLANGSRVSIKEAAGVEGKQS